MPFRAQEWIDVLVKKWDLIMETEAVCIKLMPWSVHFSFKLIMTVPPWSTEWKNIFIYIYYIYIYMGGTENEYLILLNAYGNLWNSAGHTTK